MAACYKHPSQAVSIHFAPPTSTTTTNNSRQAYASFLNSRQFNKVSVDKNLPYFIFDFVLKISFLRKGYGVRSGKEMSKVAQYPRDLLTGTSVQETDALSMREQSG
jgi:hypothetical protein